jgi:TonB family protein
MLQTSNLHEGKNLPMRAGIRHINLLLAAIIILMSTSLHLQAQQLPIEQQTSSQQNQDDKIYNSVEHPAQFPGGAKAFQKFIGENIRHPQGMVNDRVFLQFVVRKDGSLTDIKVVRGENELNKAEAVRIIKLSPKWEPAIQNGQAVNLQFTVPITFKQS